MLKPDQAAPPPSEEQVIALARTGQSDILGDLDDELPTLRINGDAMVELERRWRATRLVRSRSEYVRLVLYTNLFGEEHVANLYAERIRRVVGNAPILRGNDEATEP